MRVELDVFSGRPNPSWELTGKQPTEFLTLLGSLEPVGSAPTASEGLGYRGFLVTAQGETMSGFDRIRVFRGMAIANRGGGTEVFRDRQHSLESWLLETGRAHMEQGTAEYVRKEIELP